MSAQTRRVGKGDETENRRLRCLDLLEQAKDLTQRGKRMKFFAHEKLSGPFLQALQAFKENRPIKLVDLITIEEARQLGLLVIGPEQINQIFGTDLTMTDCPIYLALDQIKAFIAQARIDFKTDNPSLVLILVTNCGQTLNLLQLKRKFGHKLRSDWFCQDNAPDFALKPVRKMWMLINYSTNPAYRNLTYDKQQEQAKMRQEEILFAAEEAYGQLVIEAITGKCLNVSTANRTASILRESMMTFPVQYPIWVGNFHKTGGLCGSDYPGLQVAKEPLSRDGCFYSVGLATALIAEF